MFGFGKSAKLDERERLLQEREQALNAREKALNVREREFNIREKPLYLNGREKLPKNSKERICAKKKLSRPNFRRKLN